MRVLHLPTNVAGMSWGLAEGERRLGLDVDVLTTTKSKFGYRYDICLDWESKSQLQQFYSAISTFFAIRNNYDVFHFNFGTSLLNYRKFGLHHVDLRLYPKSAKKIFTYNGCDARLLSVSNQLYPTNICRTCDIEECWQSEQIRRKKIAVVSEYADHIFAVNPDLLVNLPREKSSFLPYAIAKWYDIQPVAYQIRKKIKIVHSPTNRLLKGSHYILQALENLQSKFPIEVELIENVTVDKAVKMYESADIVIDQVLAGWYGGFAVEVMKMGKPVAVYIRESDLKYIPEQMAIDLQSAVIQITPDTIAEQLEIYLENPHLLVEKSKAAMEYADTWHDPENVAKITKSIYES